MNLLLHSCLLRLFRRILFRIILFNAGFFFLFSLIIINDIIIINFSNVLYKPFIWLQDIYYQAFLTWFKSVWYSYIKFLFLFKKKILASKTAWTDWWTIPGRDGAVSVLLRGWRICEIWDHYRRTNRVSSFHCLLTY